MRLHILVSSLGSPTRDRNVTGLAVQYEGGSAWDLFDCGEGTQHRLLQTPLSLANLRRIFVSHLHGDHCYGLFGLLGSRAMAGTSAPLVLVGPRGLEEMVTTVLRLSASHLGYQLDILEVDDAGGPVFAGEPVKVTAVPLVHRVQCFGWLLDEPERPGSFDAAAAIARGVAPGPLFGRLKRGETITTDAGTTVDGNDLVGPAQPGRRCIVAGDNSDPARLLQRTGPVQLLVHEATYTETALERLGVDHGHSTAARVARAAAAGGVDNLLLTHFSPRHHAEIETLHAEAAAHYGGGLHLAEDLATYDLHRDGRLHAAIET